MLCTSESTLEEMGGTYGMHGINGLYWVIFGKPEEKRWLGRSTSGWKVTAATYSTEVGWESVEWVIRFMMGTNGRIL